jgi:hypothetical protein
MYDIELPHGQEALPREQSCFRSAKALEVGVRLIAAFGCENMSRKRP